MPFLRTRIKIDPALASSPLIGTIATASGLLISFGIARAFVNAGFIVGPDESGILIDCATTVSETYACDEHSYHLGCVAPGLAVNCAD